MSAKCFSNWFLPLLLGLVAILPGSRIAGAEDTPSEPTVTFTLDFPNSLPEHYSIQVSKSGETVFRSQGKLAADAEGEPFESRFVLSRASWQRIFQLAAQTGYFERAFAYTKGKLAFTGNKTLAYRDNQRNFAQTFNYSSQAQVQELTSIFQTMATTLEFGRRLSYFHSYQKLALDEETRRLEELVGSHSASELAAIEPILRTIAEDPSVIRMVRERAALLLAMTATTAANGSHR